MIALIMDIESDQDRVSFQIMYESTLRLFVGVANKMIQNTDDAEDIVYEVYEKIAANYGVYKKKPLDQMKRLGVTMVKNRCFDFLRRRKIMEIPVDETTIPEEYLADKETGILHDILEKESFEELKEAVRALDDEERMILTYRYDGRMKVAEIAEELGVTQKNIEYRLGMIRKKLRDMLEDKQ